MDQSRVSPVPSSSGLIANNAPNTPFPQAGFDSVIETYMRNMLRPEAFITPQQSLSPPAQLQEPVNATFWDPNIDPNLPPLNPAVSDVEFMMGTRIGHVFNLYSGFRERYYLFYLALKQC
jgi:hypothetical protein